MSAGPAHALAWVLVALGMNFPWAAGAGYLSPGWHASGSWRTGDEAATLPENLTSDGLCCFTVLLLFSLQGRMLQQGGTRRGTESLETGQIWSLR